MTRLAWPRGPVFLAAVALLTGFSTSATAQAVLQIDSAASEIHWRVYKAGAFARFGHNHVISVAAPNGRISLADNLEEATLQLGFDVGELVVDDAELRARYGEDFASVPSAEDIAGTRTNMLTAPVLNGEAFPRIELTATGLTGTGQGQSIDLSIALLGQSLNLTVPVDVLRADAAGVEVRSEFRLQHADLGMTPFSVMMGALQVAPEIDFTVHIVAVPGQD